MKYTYRNGDVIKEAGGAGVYGAALAWGGGGVEGVQMQLFIGWCRTLQLNCLHLNLVLSWEKRGCVTERQIIHQTQRWKFKVRVQ